MSVPLASFAPDLPLPLESPGEPGKGANFGSVTTSKVGGPKGAQARVQLDVLISNPGGSLQHILFLAEAIPPATMQSSISFANGNQIPAPLASTRSQSECRCGGENGRERDCGHFHLHGLQERIGPDINVQLFDRQSGKQHRRR